MGIVTAKHSFNAGDLISILPGLRHLYRTKGVKAILYQQLNLPAFYDHGLTHPTTDSNGNMVCMNEQMFEMMKPLIMQQPYIEDFKVWQGEQVDFDFDATRDRKSIPMPYGSLHHWPFALFPQMQCDLSEAWIKVPELSVQINVDAIPKSEINPKKILEIYDQTGRIYFSGNTCDRIENLLNGINLIYINRTSRYYNPLISYYFLKPIQEQCRFVGTEDEHEAFNKQWGLEIQHHKVNDFLELASLIYNCGLFIGNQSFAWHLADAMKVPRLLEASPSFPNTFPHGKDGHLFYYNETLEYYVNLYLNKQYERNTHLPQDSRQ